MRLLPLPLSRSLLLWLRGTALGGDEVICSGGSGGGVGRRGRVRARQRDGRLAARAAQSASRGRRADAGATSSSSSSHGRDTRRRRWPRVCRPLLALLAHSDASRRTEHHLLFVVFDGRLARQGLRGGRGHLGRIRLPVRPEAPNTKLHHCRPSSDGVLPDGCVSTPAATVADLQRRPGDLPG